MTTETWIGLAASIFTGISMLPQLIKIYKEKKPSDISWIMLLMLIAGLALWIWYGIKKDDYLIIISNSFALLVNLNVVILNIVFRKNRKV